MDPLGLCKIEVRYKKILEIIGLGNPINIYHAYIVTTDPNGSQYYYRGGPNPVIGGWGSIKAQTGIYRPKTPDWDTGTPPTDLVLDDGKPCDCANSKLDKAASDLNNEKTPYDPGGPNSNSTANFGLQRLGIQGHTPSVIAPGWSQPVGGRTLQ
jgi:hypothetical protein